jgi:hypothetical protein
MTDALLARAVWLEQTGLATRVRSSTWGYPAVESLHIFGLAVLLGTAVAFDLRLLGLSSRLPVDALAAHLLPWARTGFALALGSGLLLLSTQASVFLAQPLFYIKMGTIGIAVANASIFHRGIFRQVTSWNHSPHTPAPAKVAALISLAAWTTALVCGRWLAYA